MTTFMDRRNAASEKRESSSIDAHSRALMNGLDELRRADKLLDVTFIVKGVRIQAHRVVLAACSDYFQAMFSKPMKESRETEIELSDMLTVSAVRALLDYTYTSKLDLNRDNIGEILSAASYFQMNNIVLACSAYLESQIDLENCLDIVELADLYALEKLQMTTYYFMCVHFEELTETAYFLNLRYEQMEYMLSDKFPVDCPEIEVARSVANYCITNKLSLEASRRLFSLIHMNEVDINLLLRGEMENFYYQPYANVMRAVHNAQKTQHNHKPNYESPLNLRGMKQALLKIGGFDEGGLHNRISFAFPDERKWYPLTEIPHIKQSNYGVAVAENDLYIVGGSYDVCLKEYIHGFGFRYDVVHNKWDTIAPLRCDRCRFSMVAQGHVVMAIGGVHEPSEDGTKFLNIEEYDVHEDTWSSVPALPEHQSQHAAVMGNKSVYISGGIVRESVLYSFYMFDFSLRKWYSLRPMLRQRADHALVLIGDRIYACGGWYEDRVTECRVLVETIDVYDKVENEWKVETTNPVPTFHAGITALGTKIYFVGGLLSDDTTNISSEIQVYDVETKEWSTETRWENSEPTWECSCISIYMPTCRRDLLSKKFIDFDRIEEKRTGNRNNQ